MAVAGLSDKEPDAQHELLNLVADVIASAGVMDVRKRIKIAKVAAFFSMTHDMSGR